MFPCFLPSMLFSSKTLSPPDDFRYAEFPDSALLKHRTNMYTAGAAPPRSTARIVRQFPEGNRIVWSLPLISAPSARSFRSSKMPRPYVWAVVRMENINSGDRKAA